MPDESQAEVPLEIAHVLFMDVVGYSKRVADDLAQSRQWRPYLHDLGQCAVKHGVPIFVVNLYTDEVGNRELPLKFEQAAAQSGKKRFRRRYLVAGAAVVALTAMGLGW